MLDPHVLRSFIAVAELKSFTKAANKVHLTQSTVSQQIRKLEEDLGCNLIAREGKTAFTTTEGEKLLLYAKRICNLIEEAEENIKIDLEYGFVKIGVPEDIASSFIAPILAEFRKKYPKIQFSIISGISKKLWESFQSGDLDIVFIKQRKGETSGFASWKEPLKWIDHQKANNYLQETVSIVAFSENGLYRNEMINYFEETQRKWRISYESSSLASLISAVNIGFGVTLLPKRLVMKEHKILTAKDGFRSIEDFELVLHVGSAPSTLAKEVAADLVKSFKNY
ncbi:LysR family transcriptional regulator [Peredibacter sp. HCB2-198]|uniref:LysR family transcriptional regulator n=1 Tax=Peredibacter sp. HCB2-198 TaxID=3383025 RepID=UPI0038B4E53E